MTGTGLDIGKRLRGIAERIPAEMLRAEQDNARTALDAIMFYSSGDFSAAELREMYDPLGPYSILGPHPPDDPAIINIQSGDFIGSWHQDGPHVQSDGNILTTFENTSPHATFLETGTERMISRPLIEAVEEEIVSKLDARRDEAISKAISPGGRG